MAKRYHIDKEVGKGAYGIVYRAKRKVRVVSPAPTGSGSLFHRAMRCEQCPEPQEDEKTVAIKTIKIHTPEKGKGIDAGISTDAISEALPPCPPAIMTLRSLPRLQHALCLYRASTLAGV